eukprot:1388483-Amphidinium_carterae.1
MYGQLHRSVIVAEHACPPKLFTLCSCHKKRSCYTAALDMWAKQCASEWLAAILWKVIGSFLHIQHSHDFHLLLRSGSGMNNRCFGQHLPYVQLAIQLAARAAFCSATAVA